MTEPTRTPAKERPHSEANPYHMAIYLHGLVKAATLLVEDHGAATSTNTGICELLTVIEERADALARELDAPVFGDLWPELDAWLDRDPRLGLGGKARNTDHGICTKSAS